MKPKLSIYILSVLALMALAVFAVNKAHGQSVIDDYGTKPPPTRERQEAVVKFHIALELVTGKFTAGQKQVLRDALADPKQISEAHTLVFNPVQARQIFYAIGSVDISKFKVIYKLSSLADKRLLFITYDKPSRAAAWRSQLALKIATMPLSGEQIDALLNFSRLLEKQDPDEVDAYMALVEPLFTAEEKHEIFGSIGPYTEIGQFCKKKATTATKTDVAPLEGGDCVCAIGYYNYSCYSDCTGGSGCATTDGGCSIFWLRNCTGSCSQQPINQ